MGDIKNMALEQVLRKAAGHLRLRRRFSFGERGYVTVSRGGASFSAKVRRGMTLLFRPSERPRVTWSVPGTGLTWRRALPLPSLWFLSPGELWRRQKIGQYAPTVEETLDRFYPGVVPPRVVLSPRARVTLARFRPEPDERIVVSSRLAERLPADLVREALVRESVRAGLWSREGKTGARRLREELTRLGIEPGAGATASRERHIITQPSDADAAVHRTTGSTWDRAALRKEGGK